MDFFEEIGTKITQAGQKTKQVTNNLTETAKLNSRSNELTEMIKNLYTQLGQKYFELFGDEPVEEMLELCQQIQKSVKEREIVKADIQRLKGFRPCPTCGNENPIDANFCSNCSAPLPQLPKHEVPKENTCPQCGSKVFEGVHFCSKCGYKLD